MIIILEGSDKVGKSTLARTLCQKYDACSYHFSAPKGDPYKEYMGFLDQADPSKNYVLDRFHVGELVYGELYRGKSKLSLDQLWYLDLRLMSHHAVLVHCSTDAEMVKRKFIEDREETSKSEDIQVILESFKNKVNLSLLKKFNYDWQDKTCLPALEKLLDYVVQEPRLSKEELKSYIGIPEPKMLFLGDTRNERMKDKGVFESRSGKFLVKCIERIGGFSNQAVGITNSDLLTKEFYEKLGKPKIVCLGKKSLLRTTKLRLSAFHIQHPQWMFRFGGQNALNTYCKILKDIK